MLKKLFLDLNNFKSNLGSVERGDSIELNIKLLDSEDYSRSKFRVLGTKADGKYVEQIEGINLEEKDLKVILEDQFVNCEGIVKLELNVVSVETEITTKEFYFFVSNTMNASIIDSADSLPTLEKVSKYVDDAVDNLEALKGASEDITIINSEFKENEIKRKANELLRERSEKERVRLESIRTTEEADRIKAEAERKEAENKRKVAESNRKLAENTRKTNEAARVEAELNRQSLFEENEEIRNENENLRIEAEKERKLAFSNNNKFESERVEAEKLRVIEEDKRVTAEKARAKAEEERVKAETRRENTYTDFNDSEVERKNNEANRVRAEAERVNAESGRNELFNTNEEKRNSTFIESERTRERAFNEAQSNRNEAYEESERVREEAFKVSEATRNEAEEGRVAVELLRVDSEKARVLAEEERNTTFTQKEEERNNTFTQNETNRNDTFTQNEEERQGIFEEAENARKVAESKRVKAESSRVAAENKRIQAEETRVEADNLRNEKIIEFGKKIEKLEVDIDNFTVKDDSITGKKIKEHSLTRRELNEDIYKETMLYKVLGEYNSNNWIEIILKNDAIIPIGKELSLSFKTHGFVGVKSGTTGVYSSGTVYTNEFDTVDNGEITQTLTFDKEYPAKNITIIFHPKNVIDSNSFILENLEINEYEIVKVGVFQKQYQFEKMKYFDDTLITRKDVDEKFNNLVLPKKSISKDAFIPGCVDEDIVAKSSLTFENMNPISYSKFDGIKILKRPDYLSYSIKLEDPIEVDDKLEIKLTIKDNTKISEEGEEYNGLSFKFWGNGIDNISDNTAKSNVTFENIKFVLDNERKFRESTVELISQETISNPYLRLYGTISLPYSGADLDTLVQFKIFKNDVELQIAEKGIYNSPSGEFIEIEYLENQFLNSKCILEELEKYKKEAIQEAIERTMIENCWLYKKRWGILGDSLSDPGYPQSESVYWLKISQKYNMEVDKQAKSGASTSNGHGTATQVENLNGNFDLITVWIGTNDAQQEATDANSFKTNIEALIRRIYERFPTTKLFFITPLANQKTTDPQEQSLEKGVILYVNAIKEVCNRYSIPVLDMYANSNLNPHVGQINNTFYANADKCHMNSKGYLERINPVIEQFLINQR